MIADNVAVARSQDTRKETVLHIRSLTCITIFPFPIIYRNSRYECGTNDAWSVVGNRLLLRSLGELVHDVW